MNPKPNALRPFLILLCIILFASTTFAQKKKPLTQFNWLLGTWTMKDKDGTSYETWHYVNDSTFQSRAYLVRGSKDTVEQEAVKLVYRGKALYYIPTVNGQNNHQPVTFKITSVKKNEFISENPKHDFPQRVAYRLEAPGKLYAWIDGTNAKKQFKKIDYHMEKVK
jgi:hypothetical protein